MTIIRTGNMARDIATHLLAGGHGVTLLGTGREKAKKLAGEIGGSVSPGTVGDRIEGEVAVLAVPFEAAATERGSLAGWW